MPSDKANAGAMWNCEMSMLDVDGRGWMLGPMFDMHTGQLLVSNIDDNNYYYHYYYYYY